MGFQAKTKHLENGAVHPGSYSLVPNMLFGARAYVIGGDKLGDAVFEIMPDCSLRPAGSLPGLAKWASKTGSAIAFHPSEPVAAYATENGMAVSRLDGRAIWQMNTKVAGLLFSWDGEELWLAERFGEDLVEISLVDWQSGMENSILATPLKHSGNARLCNRGNRGHSQVLAQFYGPDGDNADTEVFVLESKEGLGETVTARRLDMPQGLLGCACTRQNTKMQECQQCGQCTKAWAGLARLACLTELPEKVDASKTKAEAEILEPEKTAAGGLYLQGGMSPAFLVRHGDFLVACTGVSSASPALVVYRNPEAPSSPISPVS